TTRSSPRAASSTPCAATPGSPRSWRTCASAGRRAVRACVLRTRPKRRPRRPDGLPVEDGALAASARRVAVALAGPRPGPRQAPGDGWVMAPAPPREVRPLYWDLFQTTEVWVRLEPVDPDGKPPLVHLILPGLLRGPRDERAARAGRRARPALSLDPGPRPHA